MKASLLSILLIAISATTGGGYATAAPNEARAGYAKESKFMRPSRLLNVVKEESETILQPALDAMRVLCRRDFSDRCNVALTSVKSWRPMCNFGDSDAKVRVFNPKLGVALRYRF